MFLIRFCFNVVVLHHVARFTYRKSGVLLLFGLSLTVTSVSSVTVRADSTAWSTPATIAAQTGVWSTAAPLVVDKSGQWNLLYENVTSTPLPPDSGGYTSYQYQYSINYLHQGTAPVTIAQSTFVGSMPYAVDPGSPTQIQLNAPSLSIDSAGGLHATYLAFDQAPWAGGGAASVMYTEKPGATTYAILVGSRAPSGGVNDAVRGDIDVDHVAAKLSWVASENKYEIKVNWNDPDTVAASIQSDLSLIKSRIRAGDTLVFYYSGHGSLGSQPSIEEINAVAGGQLTDVDLATMLADPALANVRKLVLLDSCHSGGFVMNDAPNDLDLRTVSDIAFLSAATEAGTTTADADGTGHWTNKILPYLDENTTFSNLAYYAATAYADRVTGFFKDDGYGTVDCNAMSYFSPDFDPNVSFNGTTVPEPSTLSLLGIGTIGLLVGYVRRRNRTA